MISSKLRSLMVCVEFYLQKSKICSLLSAKIDERALCQFHQNMRITLSPLSLLFISWFLSISPIVLILLFPVRMALELALLILSAYYLFAFSRMNLPGYVYFYSEIESATDLVAEKSLRNNSRLLIISLLALSPR